MIRNDPKRLTRRTKHPKSRVLSGKSIGETKDGKPFTQAHAEDFENEVRIALHESSHIMAAWMLGQPLGGMQFNDGTDTSRAAGNAKERPEAVIVNGIRVEKYPDEVPHFYAEVVVGHPLAEMQAQSMGERLVNAKEHAFISLAGVFGCSNDAWSDNPLSEFETNSHLSEATQNLRSLLASLNPKQGTNVFLLYRM